MAKVTYAVLQDIRSKQLAKHPYQMLHFADFDYSILNSILWCKRSGRGAGETYNDIIIMADTETSKKPNNEQNHVVAWTISLRAFHRNIVTLWGQKPSDFASCMYQIMDAMSGEFTIIYFHNLSYDWQFLRQFLFKKFGYPDKQLNTKTHYPIYIKWTEAGLIIKDSLILAQRSLEKWADDMDVEHKKAVGLWDYSKLRNQSESRSADELEYIEYDTLAGVECLDALMLHLNKKIYSMPYTATGIPREAVRKIAKANRGRERFLSMCMDYETYLMAVKVYHGGYTHANRHEIGWINHAIAYDFCSSYPYCMLAEKYPMERFMKVSNKTPEEIISMMDDYAFMFKLVIVKPRLKGDYVPMPSLQFSKCVKTINAVNDNGRVLCAEYVEIYLTEQDLYVIQSMYDWDYAMCVEVMASAKDYLPRWFTDYIYECFRAKTMLKGGDPVAYSMAKSVVNSLYGMCVQRSIRDDIQEDYETGEFFIPPADPEEAYQTYLNSRNSILPYQWGVWVTAYAFRNLFDLGGCVADDGIWLYSDTDSAYATKWDEDKIRLYNERCKQKLIRNGYGAVIRDNREYWLGVAEFDGEYSQFKSCGAKRYCGRSVKDGELHLTVAGVPKRGVRCLGDDIQNFRTGMIFDGLTTGKLTHKYIYVDEIYIDENGNETGDSVDLSPCDYLLDSVNVVDWESLYEEEIEVQVYESEISELEWSHI